MAQSSSGISNAVSLEDVSALNRQDAKRELIAECKQLLADTDALLDRAKSISSDAYTLAREELDRKLATLRVRYDELHDEAIQRTQLARDNTDRYVRQNPWQSIAIAAAVGAILGAGLSRR
ncbi:MAG: DUF883 domain-containing protein [Casimicrobiaceae bacterium]